MITKLVLCTYLVPWVACDLCAHCTCDPASSSVQCTDQSMLIRTVSLLPWVNQLYLHHISLPHPPHFLFHSKLRILRINNCGLEELSAHSLLPLPNLEVVSLSHNHLHSLPATVFRRLTRLKVIDISHNRINDLSSLEWVLADDLLLDILDIGHNPIQLATKGSYLPPSKQLMIADANVEHVNSTSIIFRKSELCLEEKCRILSLPRHSHLTSVDLSGNQLTIHGSTLEVFNNVSYLNLAQSKVPADFANWLETKSQVRHLNLSHAEVTLDDEEWHWCGPHMETLDISGLKIKRLRLGRDCPIKRLFARDNLLEFAVLEAPMLESIHFDRNLFTEWPLLPPGIVLDRLETFSISSNLLTSLPPHALTQFPALQHLDISKNQLSEIDPRAFPSLGMQLISVDLSFNQLTTLVHPVLPSLLYLDISSNDINDINPVFFAGMPLLQHFHISNNPSIFSRCLDKCWSDHLDILTNLVDLDASNCALTRRLRLSHITDLKTLVLRGNQLYEIDGHDLPPSLATLDVGENRIHFVSNFSEMPSLRELRLDSNPLICDCTLRQLQPWLLNQSKISDPQAYYCFSSSWQYPLLPYITSVRPCEHPNTHIMPLAASALVGVLIIVLLSLLILIGAQRFCGSISHRYKRLYAEFPVRL